MGTDYKTLAKESRLKVLEMVYRAQTSHIGSLMGCADILAVLFEKIDFEKDKLVVGKSWAAALIYYHLWRKGKITQEQLDSYCIGDSPFIGLLEPIEGIDLIPFGIGSMGMGLPAAVGFALSKKRKKEEGIVYCFMSDGELQTGMTWEAALIAAHHKLDNLVVIVDWNRFCAMGKIKDILSLDPIDRKFALFGWSVSDVDGHSHKEMEGQLDWPDSLPRAIIARTIKGKGVPNWENDNLWHYAQIKSDDYEYAKTCLNS